VVAAIENTCYLKGIDAIIFLPIFFHFFIDCLKGLIIKIIGNIEQFLPFVENIEMELLSIGGEGGPIEINGGLVR